jgi:hypothetical protein
MCKTLEFLKVLRSGLSEIVPINDDSVNTEIAFFQKQGKVLLNFSDMRIVLLEINDDPVPDYIIMHIHCAIQVITPGDFVKNIFIPCYDVARAFTERHMDNMFAHKKLVGGDVDEAGGFPDAFPGGYNADTTLAEAAVY